MPTLRLGLADARRAPRGWTRTRRWSGQSVRADDHHASWAGSRLTYAARGPGVAIRVPWRVRGAHPSRSIENDDMIAARVLVHAETGPATAQKQQNDG